MSCQNIQHRSSSRHLKGLTEVTILEQTQNSQSRSQSCVNMLTFTEDGQLADSWLCEAGGGQSPTEARRQESLTYQVTSSLQRPATGYFTLLTSLRPSSLQIMSFVMLWWTLSYILKYLYKLPASDTWKEAQAALDTWAWKMVAWVVEYWLCSSLLFPA